MKTRESLTIRITEHNKFDGIHPPHCGPSDVAHVVRCEREKGEDDIRGIRLDSFIKT